MKERLLIGTRNPGKTKRWSQYFGDKFEILSLEDVGINFEVEEGFDSLQENAIKKAKIYAEISGILTLSEDTGFFMEELGGKPGVAVRRWGGELSNDISDEIFLDFFKKKIEGLKNTRSWFEYEVAISTPNGEVKTLNKKSYGYIDKEKLHNIDNHESGYPLSKCFINDFDGKTWMECNENEREKRDEKIISEIRLILEDIIAK